MAWLFRRKNKVTQLLTTDSASPSTSRSQNDQMIGSRRYLDEPDAPYQLPRDLVDQNRLDFQHFIFRQILRGNYVSPIRLQAGGKILDVGTGTGRWAIEMALEFPHVQVYGVDLEPSRVTTASPQEIPPNYHFLIGNVLKGLPFPDGTIDFVHQRALAAGIPSAQWIPEIRELVRVTRPGGWIEILEGGAIFTQEGPLTRRWLSLLEPLGKMSGIDFTAAVNLAQLVAQAGLSCQSRELFTPLGAWGGRIGSMLQTDITALFESLAPRFVQLGLSSEAEITLLRSGLPKEWEEYHTQIGGVLAYGQRPL